MPHDVISTCPVCSNELAVTRLHCRSCGTTLEGDFSVGRFGRLNRDQLALLESFLRSRGNLREMERELGISYPTVRSRVEALVRALGLRPAGRRRRRSTRPTAEPAVLARTREEILEALARHEMSADDAAAAIRALGRTASMTATTTGAQPRAQPSAPTASSRSAARRRRPHPRRSTATSVTVRDARWPRPRRRCSPSTSATAASRCARTDGPDIAGPARPRRTRRTSRSTLPRRATVVVETASADIEVDGLARRPALSDDVGRPRPCGPSPAGSPSRPSRATSTSAPPARRTSRLRTVSGDVELRAGTLRSLEPDDHQRRRQGRRPAGRPGPFAIETVSGDVLLAPAGDVRIEMATMSRRPARPSSTARSRAVADARSLTIGYRRPAGHRSARCPATCSVVRPDRRRCRPRRRPAPDHRRAETDARPRPRDRAVRDRTAPSRRPTRTRGSTSCARSSAARSTSPRPVAGSRPSTVATRRPPASATMRRSDARRSDARCRRGARPGPPPAWPRAG